MTSFRDKIEEAARATSIVSQTRFSWFGRQSAPLPRSLANDLPASMKRGFLLYNLNAVLYNHFYVLGRATPVVQEDLGIMRHGRTPFLQSLSEANCGKGCWDEGWQNLGEENGQIVAGKQGLSLWLRHGEFEIAVEPQSGEYLRVAEPKEFVSLSPGFYMAQGDRPLTAPASQQLVRVYWNLTSQAAPILIQRTTHLLNDAGLAFKLKVISDPLRYKRCDAGVLYIDSQDWVDLVPLLEVIHKDVSQGLKQQTPAFTHRLAPGLGLAEDPGKGVSFGQHRCGLVAEGFVRAFETGASSLADRLQSVEECFAAEDISLDAPYLKRSSHNRYAFNLHSQTQDKETTSPPHGERVEKHDAVDAALSIGRRLCAEAVWHAGRCTWIGDRVSEPGTRPDVRTASFGALGADIYSGTSGIGLFLAELAATTHDVEVRRAAIGAIDQAFNRTDFVPSRLRLGLFTGWGGIAFAATRTGFLLKEPRLVEQAAALIERLIDHRREAHELDFMSGNAGLILALLALCDLPTKPRPLEFAVDLGQELLEASERSRDEMSWPLASHPQWRNLTGLSHGAAGMGSAFTELYRVTGSNTFREAAILAFNYERHCYNSQSENWPDFRGVGRRRTSGPIASANAWCHGAPGIALSRVRAAGLLEDDLCQVEATRGLGTARDFLGSALAMPSADWSLCHGLPGVAEVLMLGRTSLDPVTWPRIGSLVLQVASRGIQLEQGQTAEAYSGNSGNRDWSLMTGEAGLGYFLLRLADPMIPSVLDPGVDKMLALD